MPIRKPKIGKPKCNLCGADLVEVDKGWQIALECSAKCVENARKMVKKSESGRVYWTIERGEGECGLVKTKS